MVEDDKQLFANELIVEENGDSDSDDEFVIGNKSDTYWIKKLENRIPKK